LMRSVEPTDVPPYFCTINAMTVHAQAREKAGF